MNNCYANYGAVNARQIARLLEDLRPEIGGIAGDGAAMTDAS
jgi:hypothetical protein